MQRTSGNIFLGYLGAIQESFLYFSMVVLDHWGWGKGYQWEWAVFPDTF